MMRTAIASQQLHGVGPAAPVKKAKPGYSTRLRFTHATSFFGRCKNFETTITIICCHIETFN